MEFCISRGELEIALQQLNIAVDNGFKSSLAVLRIYTAGETISDFKCRYDSLIIKAHPTNPSLDWGRTKHPKWQKFINGEIVETDDY